ncbi:Gag-Pol polyprotein, partial [Mucuna pruriens]
MTHAKPCYIDNCNFLMASTYPQGASKAYKDKLGSKAKYYIWDDPYLWRMCNDQVIRKCIMEPEIYSRSKPLWIQLNQLESLRLWAILAHHILGHARIRLNLRTVPESWNGYKRNAPIAYAILWVEAKATKSNDVKTVVEFLKFGVPKALISDQGSHFYNRAMATLLEKYGVVHRIAAAYHHQSNSQVEVFNKEIKNYLLEDALWMDRTAYRTPLGMSPYRIVFDKACHLPSTKLTRQSRSATWPMTKPAKSGNYNYRS